MAPDKNRRVHLRGLVKLTGKSPRPVQLAATELERARVLQSEPEGNKKMFSINPNHPLFDSVKQMVADVGHLPSGDRKLLQQFFTRHTAQHREPPKMAVVSSRQIETMLQQAHNELGLAQRTVDSPSTSLQHCYQAMLHAMTAALLARGMSSPRSHHQIIRTFHKHYVAFGKVSKEFVEQMPSLADHDNPPSDPTPHVNKTLEFVLTVREVINNP